jgi:hypothetical protein
MTDQTFDALLSRTLRTYADGGVRPIDAMAVAESAAARPRHRPMFALLPRRSQVLALTAIAVLVAAIIALAVGTRPPPPSLLGEISTTQPMVVSVWVPATEVLSDGSVLIVGPIGSSQRLHAETWDPASGTFTTIGGVPTTLSVPGAYGSVLLADGDVLLVVRRYGGRLVEYGGFALRFDRVSRTFRPAGPFTQGTLPERIADFGFANWPATVAPDGTVRWTSPVRGDGEPTIVYDPLADTFSLASPGTGATAEFRPTEDSLGDVVLGDGGRHLWLEGGVGSPPVTATVVDAHGRIESEYEWPLANGGQYLGALLPDGRVLLAGGGSTALVDPATGAFDEVDLGVDLRIRERWLDGKVLLTATPDGSVEAGGVPSEAYAWVFDPTTDEFSQLSDTPTPAHSTWTLLDDGRVLIIPWDDGSADIDGGPALVLR